MRLSLFVFALLSICIISCQQDPIFDTVPQGELLVQEKWVSDGLSPDTSILTIERDANKRWVRIAESFEGLKIYEVVANRNASGKILTMRTIDMNTNFGVYDTSFQSLFYLANSDRLNYALTEDKDGNGLPRIDSIKYFYDGNGRVASHEYHTKDAGSYILYVKESFEYDTAGNVKKNIVEQYNSVSSYLFEYDYSKKSPIYFSPELQSLLILPQDYFAVNLLKKNTWESNGQIFSVDSVNLSTSQFNALSRPTELYMANTFHPFRRFFKYE
jgi:hypothetical protein